MMYYLYVIIDPSVNKVIYVGRTKDIEKRRLKYKRRKGVHSLKLGAYLNELRRKNIQPLIVVIAQFDEKEIVGKEIDYIKFFQQQSPLLNTAHVREFRHEIKRGSLTQTGKIL